ncbi:MOB kinase activator 2 [Megalops cyprinoides]|uniref:MOB kinase activator 2 n=1 Tax=Megalops cyprinoides TaxID=118141 RepID=UPI0018640C24|nr:MOB kinase activator 2 [Megalops cyprinoides]
MGGCHSYISSGSREGDTASKAEEFSDITGHNLKNNNTQAAPSLEEKPYLMQDYVSERIADIDVKTLSVLPDGFDKAEWMASHTITFFKHINMLSSALSDFCTTRTCPTTTGPGDMTYYWTDEHGKKLKCSAPLYTDYTMSYIQELLTDEEVFPTHTGSSFPNGFVFLVQRIFLYLFHALAHLYWAHFRDVVRMEMHPHLNTVFAHLVTFGREFQLLEPAETAPMEDLISTLCLHHTS